MKNYASLSCSNCSVWSNIYLSDILPFADVGHELLQLKDSSVLFSSDRLNEIVGKQ